jgi:ATP-dependent Clp protease adaptor protein ClpS
MTKPKALTTQIMDSDLKVMERASEANDNKRDPDEGTGLGTQTLIKPKPTLAEPSMYKVLLLNDDFTPMDFVVLVLKQFFSKSTEDATKIMLEVHHQGSGVAGVFSHEIAETKVYLVNDFAKRNKHPLKCVMEKDV